MFLIHSDTLVAVEDNYKCNAANAMFSRDRDTERNLRFTIQIEVDCNTVLGREVAWNRNDRYDRAY